MLNLGLHNLYEIVSSATSPVFLHCGKPNKLKNYEEMIGKKLEINNKLCIIGYPLIYLFSKGESYERKIKHTIEVLKNELLALGEIKYRDGKIETRKLESKKFIN